MNYETGFLDSKRRFWATLNYPNCLVRVELRHHRAPYIRARCCSPGRVSNPPLTEAGRVGFLVGVAQTVRTSLMGYATKLARVPYERSAELVDHGDRI
jgi:hypothetical protein